MKKFLASLMILVVSMGLLAGCGSEEKKPEATDSTESTQTTDESNASTESEQEPVTINVTMWTDEKEELTAIKAAFEEENPNIKVELMEFPSEEYKDKLTIQLAGGADIDVITHKNTAEYADLASKGQLLNLEPLVKQDNVDVAPYGPLYDGLKVEGELFGVPYRKTVTVLYYNKDLFDAAGVDYPSEDMTWDAFRELAKTMTTDTVAGAYIHTWPQLWYGVGLQKGASIIDEDLTPFMEALQFRMDLEADGSIMSFANAKATSAHYKTEFAKGQTAMNIIGDFHVAQLRDLEAEGEVTFDWDVVPMPHPEGVEPNTTYGTANPISVAINSEKQEAAWEFVKYVSGEQGAKIYAEHGNLPAYSNDEIQNIFVGDGSQRPENIEIFTEAKVYLENPSIPGVGIIKDEIYGREAELTFVGERSVEETFEVIKERIQEELNK